MRKLRLALAVVLVVLPVTLAAQSSQHHRATNPVALDRITILQTTDVHDHANGAAHVGLDVDPTTGTSTVGAYSRMAAYINYVRANAGHTVILVDSGDWTMGTLYDLTLASNPLALYFINAMHYDAITLGNHEFDYTPKGLAQILNAARTSFNFRTPIVASNMNLGGNIDLVPFFGAGKAITPTYVEHLPNGLAVGYIGLMGEDAATDAAPSAPVNFSPLSQHYADIQAIVDDLRNNQGAQIVIALSHSGTSATGTSGEDVSLAQNVHGINVIASGHTHTPLAAVHAVTNGSWTTQIIDAGAFGTNVARLDLDVHRGNGTTTVVTYANPLMTDASLTSIKSGLKADATITGLVNATDLQLNAALGPILSQYFADYSATSLGKGIYHVAGTAAQDMTPNDKNVVLSPNGLGDLAADAVRNIPNAIIAQTLAGGGSVADPTPYQLGVVGTGVIRNGLQGNVPLSFADIYDVLPLGISPDTSQLLPVGYPMISTYVTTDDVKKICALQLVGQSNLVGSSYYLNLSGVQYTFKSAELDTYFKYATAAAVLELTDAKYTAGSPAATAAINALFQMFFDHGAALIAAAQGGNPYAQAMVNLNNTNPDANQINANLAALGDVGAAAISGTQAVSALVFSKAVAAIDTVSGFAPTDVKNTGTATPLSASSRVRGAVDLYAVLLLGAVQSQFGITITPYQSATGSTVLSSADFPTLLGNRIDASPTTAGVQELKEWMALLSNVGSTLGGTIGSDYLSTPLFSQFPTYGAAVKVRNASYPLAQIGQLATTLGTLQAAP